MRLLAILILLIVLVNCVDRETSTLLIFKNGTNEKVDVFIRYYRFNPTSTEDTVFSLDPDEERLWEILGKLGKREFRELDDFIEPFDSLVSVRRDTSISTNLLNRDQWIFESNNAYEGRYVLLIEEEDFN